MTVGIQVVIATTVTPPAGVVSTPRAVVDEVA